MASTRIYRSISSAGTTTKATFSACVKRSGLAEAFLFLSQENGNNNFRIRFNPEVINIEVLQGGSVTATLSTTRTFRDTSAWYHIVVTLDSTLATADDRMKLYVNGVQETSFSARTNPSQNFSFGTNDILFTHKKQLIYFCFLTRCCFFTIIYSESLYKCFFCHRSRF